MRTDDELTIAHQGAYGTATRSDRGWEIELHAGTGRLGVPVATHLLTKLGTRIDQVGGGPMRWRVPAPTAEHRRIASNAGYDGSRTLVQMRRTLPAPWSTDLTTRAFDPERDLHEWLRVNNAAFQWHPEQSNWTVDHVRRQMAEPWFDPSGFLVHQPDGPMLGFCWTKVHTDTEPAIGEIFIIAVDPSAAGQGLGKALVLAGLDHLAREGLGQVLLYTESDNAPALALYDRLGFEVHHEIVVFERQVETRIES